MGFNYELAGKGITKAITDYGNIMGERSKLQAGILANEFKARQNLIYDKQKKQQEHDQKLGWMKQMQSQMGQGGEENLQGDLLSREVKPEIRATADGSPTMHYPTHKAYVTGLIRQKQKRGIPLSEKEQQMLDNELGLANSETEDYRSGLKDLVRGNTSQEDLMTEYPDKRDQIEGIAQDQKSDAMKKRELSKAKIQKVPFYDLIKRAKPGYAAMNDATKAVAGNISTYADLLDLHEKAEMYESQGVDMQALVDYYKEEFIEMIKNGVIKKGK